MTNSFIYQDDYFVVLRPDREAEILSKLELLETLEKLLENFADEAPSELAKLSNLKEKAVYLMDNYCQWNIEAGIHLQWYVTRLEK